MKNTSTFLSLNSKDLLKGLLMAFIGAIVTGLMTSLQADPPAFPVTWIAWKPIVLGGISMVIAYLAKNFFTNSKDEFLTKEQPK